MAESKLWEGWPARIVGITVASVASAMIGAHTDLIRDLPRISPRIGEFESEMRTLEVRVRACEAYQIKHEEYATTNSRELHEAVARNTGEIEKLRERIDRALERRGGGQ